MKILVAIFLVLLMPLTVFADEYNPDPDEEKLLLEVKKAPKKGLLLLLKYNLKKLDAVYTNALKESEPELREALIKSQEAWKAFYDADSVVAAWNAKGGSYAVPARLEQMIYHVRLRIYLLATPQGQGWIEIPTVQNPESEVRADQSATSVDSKAAGKKKPKPKSEGRSQ